MANVAALAIIMNQLNQFFREQWEYGIRGTKKAFTFDMINLPENKTCFIVAGGSSLKDFDFSLLKQHFTIGINNAFTNWNPTINFATDHQFYIAVKDTEDWKRFKGLKVFMDIGNLEMDDIYYIKSVGYYGYPWDLKEGIHHGNNSGYGALNLALVLGFKTIYLLGFDMQPIDGKFHYLNYWKSRPGYAKILADFIPGFNKLAKHIKDREIKVDIYNCSPNSLLKCFPFKEVSSCL